MKQFLSRWATLLCAAGVIIAAIGMGMLTINSIRDGEQINVVLRRMAAAGNVDRITSNRTLAGFVDVHKTIGDYVARLYRVPGLTREDALQIQALIGTANNYSEEFNQMAVEYIAVTAQSPLQAHVLARSLTQAWAKPIQP